MRDQALGGGGLSTVVSLVRRHEPGRTARHDLTHAFYEIVASLPAVAGRGLEVEVMTLDERAHKRYDADLLHGEPDILIELAEGKQRCAGLGERPVAHGKPCGRPRPRSVRRPDRE
jgi:hypothetical protein